MKLSSIFLAGIIFCFLCFSHSDAQQVNWGYKFTKGHKYFYRYIFDQTDETEGIDKTIYHDCFIHTIETIVEIEDILSDSNYVLSLSVLSEKHDSPHGNSMYAGFTIRPYEPIKSKVTISKNGDFISGVLIEDSPENAGMNNISRQHSDSSRILSGQKQKVKSMLEELIHPYPKVDTMFIGRCWSDTLSENRTANHSVINLKTGTTSTEPSTQSSRMISAFTFDSMSDSTDKNIFMLSRKYEKEEFTGAKIKRMGDEVFYLRQSDGITMSSGVSTIAIMKGVQRKTVFRTSLKLLKEE